MLSDKKNIYFRNETIKELFLNLNIEEVGLYMTIKSFDYDNPDGVEKDRILNSSADEHDDIEKILKNLEKKGFIKIYEDKIKAITY